MEDKKIIIAKIISAHGIKGEVKIITFCKDLSDLEKYRCFFKNGDEAKIDIINKKSVKFSKSGDKIVRAKISGIDERNQAETLKDKEIFINRKDLWELEEDEFYYTDLIGLNVVSDDKKIGKIINIYDFGAGEMLEIEFDNEYKSENLEKIENFPFKNEYFGKVDIKNGFIEFLNPKIIEIK